MGDGQTGSPSPSRWVSLLALIFGLGLALIIFFVVSGLREIQPLYLWFILATLIVLLLLAVGLKANGKWYGAIIDVRNRASLSRLQISLWTLLIISAYLALALSRAASDPFATYTASQKAIKTEECQAAFLKNQEGIEDLKQLRLKDPEAAQAAMERAQAHCHPGPLKIYFPPELLLALGISTASFAGSTLVQQIKRNKSAISYLFELEKKLGDAEKSLRAKEENYRKLSEKLAEYTAVKLTAEEKKKDPQCTAQEQESCQKDIDQADLGIQTLTPQFNLAKQGYEEARTLWENAKTNLATEDKKKEGLLKVNESPQQASLSDIFQGDEIGNYQLIDLAKVQMFFFTVAILISYGVTLGGLLTNSATVLAPFGVNLPPFSAELNTLLAISHAGYLTVKSVDHTKTQ
ncbi:MAG: hypothetical protein PHW74_00500 [Desulfobacca sp.]|nr:hypothetical protein [Desulfobacca sp.]